MSVPSVFGSVRPAHWDALAARCGYLFVVHLSVAEQPLSARLHLRKLLSTKRLLTEIGERGLGVTSVLGV